MGPAPFLFWRWVRGEESVWLETQELAECRRYQDNFERRG